jgi:hypothetical protein
MDILDIAVRLGVATLVGVNDDGGGDINAKYSRELATLTAVGWQSGVE